jgi:hypothetical protein
MKLLPLLAVLLLTGCATAVPVAMKFPDVPKDMLITCEDLEQVKPTEEQLSEMMKVVTKNYGSYYECKVKVDAWIDWYKKQKEISDSVTKK